MSQVCLTYIRKMMALFYVYEGRLELFYQQAYLVMEQEMLSEQGRKVLCEMIDDCFYGIVNDLRSQYKELKEEDIEFIVFLVAGFSARDLCIIYKLERIESVYVRCSRLARQMNLGCSLSAYLRDRVNELRNKMPD